LLDSSNKTKENFMPILKLTSDDLKTHIKETPELLSILYDANMMPETAADEAELAFILGAAYFHKYIMKHLIESNVKDHPASEAGSGASSC
jgi:hypothetical protein